MWRVVRARFEFGRKWRLVEKWVGGRGDCWIGGWQQVPEFGGEWGPDVRVVGRGVGRAKRWAGMRGRRMLSGARGDWGRDRPW